MVPLYRKEEEKAKFAIMKKIIYFIGYFIFSSYEKAYSSGIYFSPECVYHLFSFGLTIIFRYDHFGYY